MKESFEERYINKKTTEKSESVDGFLFPKESLDIKKAIDEEDRKINESVKKFVNNLEKIEPWLTKQLLNIFENFKKDPLYSWLSESDLWLHSLGELYDTNKIPSPLESILNEMISLLTQYKSESKKSKTLEEMMVVCAGFEKKENEDMPSGLHWTINPTTSTNWWRWNV